MGLSPRWRGNPGYLRPGPRRHRSIPALAGQPASPTPNTEWRRVYPRAGGATSTDDPVKTAGEGLSPRWRGNQAPLSIVGIPCRSIPALAGQPVRAAHLGHPEQVYPRAGGATPGQGVQGLLVEGLSPRWRGNHPPEGVVENIRRSIPALAGQPTVRNRCTRTHGVYPRAGGATCFPRWFAWSLRGLSPRWRGNRVKHVIDLEKNRSIPALAGQPIVDLATAVTNPVYPRAGGATTFV